MNDGYRNAFYTKVAVVMTAILLWGAPTWAAQQAEEVTTVHAVGSSNIRGSDMSASRNQAIAGSLVSAVTNVLTDIVPSNTLVRHFQEISKQILSQTDQFIRDYKMLTESTQAKKHRVIVRATVSVQRLKSVLDQSGIYLGQKTYPSILYCIAEKQINDQNFKYWWGQQQEVSSSTAIDMVSRASREKGLVVISPNLNTPPQPYSSKLSITEAVSLGRDMQADVVVIGEAIAQEATNTIGTTLRSYRANVSVRAYLVQSSKEIGNAQHVSIVTAADPLSGGTEALEKASVLTGEDLSGQIVKSWFSKDAGTAKVEIFVEGLSGNIANFVKFRGALSSMSGVGNVQRKEMQSDTAVLLVDYQGNAGALADALMRQNYGTFSLNIAEPEGNSLRLQLVNIH